MSSGCLGGANSEGTNEADLLPQSDQFGQYPGYQYPGYQPQPFGPGSRTNALAIAALVCGIGQFLLGLLVVANILLAVPALVLGVVGLRQTTTRGERGRGMAIAGIVLGALGIIYFALVLILLVLATGYRFLSGACSGDGAATNASCGTSTRPITFIRRLPSFCFSSSLRFGVMSPP